MFPKDLWPMPGSDEREIEEILLRDKLRTHRIEALEVAPDVYERLVALEDPAALLRPEIVFALPINGVAIEACYVLALGKAQVVFGAEHKMLWQGTIKLNERSFREWLGNQ